jgi:hypothetical protein
MESRRAWPTISTTTGKAAGIACRQSMSSAADSPARTSASLGRAQDSPESDLGSGLNTPDSFASFDRATCSWRTSQRCLDGDWALFSETWPRAGTTRNGTAFQRAPLVPHTSAIESGLWPTPTIDGNYNRKGASKTSGDGLATAVKRWPTPTARDHKSDSCSPAFRAKRDAMAIGKTLPWVLGGLLNPTWVEWLMGYPAGWTVCEGWGTRSSRRSRSGSGTGSSKRKG